MIENSSNNQEMASGNNKKRKNNKKNKLKRANQIIQNNAKNDTEELDEGADDEFEHQPKKRNLSEDDLNDENEPKRKKKKKQLVPTDSTKGKMSIRQMKREKHLQRLAEEAAASKDQLKSQCISYLSQWKHDRQNWKFMKAKQVWLYKNKFSSYLLPDSSWPVFLEYFESAKGNIRNLLLDDATKIIKQMDQWTETQNSTKESPQKMEDEDKKNAQETTEEPTKPDDTAYKRARDLIQCLSE